MYPQCRHVRPSSDRCNAAAIKGNHWCYFHARLHEQQAQQAKRIAQEAERRSRDAGRQPRLANGTFAPSEEIPKSIPESVLDQGIYPVEAGDHREPATLNSHGSAYAETASLPLQLTAVEDSASIQLALIEVLQSLAAHQLDPKRAGLLLYGLQVASANAKNVQIHANSIRSISYTKEGIPLATQEHGWDVEDIEEADRLAEEEGED
jgi:hypothetical protein